MRILSVRSQNFGSYKQLDYDFRAGGLTLISGPTGSGKSTFMDVIPWCLFGRTAKDGNADEIKSWNAKESTAATVYFENGLEITRVRGKTNDLYFLQEKDTGTANIQRGKDLNDTQKLINDLLGFNCETYLAGAYMHEFSQTSQFFNTSAKNRRLITEQMADLSMTKDLAFNLAEYKKEVKKAKEQAEKDKTVKEFQAEHLSKTLKQEEANQRAWDAYKSGTLNNLYDKLNNYEKETENKVKELKLKHSNKGIEYQYSIKELEKTVISDDEFEQKREKLKANLALLGDSKCPTCGAPHKVSEHMVLQKELTKLEYAEYNNNLVKIEIVELNDKLEKHNNSLEELILIELAKTNPYQEQYAILLAQHNPHTEQITNLQAQLENMVLSLKESEKQHTALKVKYSDLELLGSINETFRSVCLNNTVTFLEHTTNVLLTEHFDAEIKVKFDSEKADTLDVTITKDGNECSYSQLSKGQRQILKLCFGVSVMKAVSNHSGVKFYSLFFDEALDGIDDSMKSRAFGLLEKLSLDYDNIFVIDHAEALKTMFLCRYDVNINSNGQSNFKKA